MGTVWRVKAVQYIVFFGFDTSGPRVCGRNFKEETVRALS